MWRIGEKERRDLSRFRERDLKAFLVDKRGRYGEKYIWATFAPAERLAVGLKLEKSGAISKVSDNEAMLACQMHQNRAIGSEFALF
jgi:hypothetical protein